MADTTRVVEEKIVVTDNATKPLGAMATAAGKVKGAFSSIIGIAKGMGGLAGAFAIGSAIKKTEELYGAVKQVKVMTGMSAENSFAMVQTFRRGGIALEQVTRTIGRMQYGMEGVEDAVEGQGKKAQGLQADYKRLGIDMRKGPEAVLFQMAKGVQQNKVGIRDTARLMGLGGREALKMYGVLKKGPEELKKWMEEAKNDPTRITESSLKSFSAMKKSRMEFGMAWEGLVRVFYTSLMPAITKVTQKLTHMMESLKSPTAEWGKMLGDILTSAADNLGVIVKMLIANKALFMLTGKGLMGTAGGALKGAGVDIRAAAGRGAEWASGGAMGGGPATLMRGVGGALGGIMGIVKAFLKIAGLGAIFMVIAAAFMAIVKHSEGIRALIAKVVEGAGALFKQIMELFAPDAFLGKALKWVAETILDVMVSIINGMRTVMMMIKEQYTWGQAKAVIGAEEATRKNIKDTVAAVEKLTPKEVAAKRKQLQAMGPQVAEAAAQAGVELPDKFKELTGLSKPAGGIPTPPERRSATVNQDFRGSKFDIKQEFAEGFDPDKISVLMANQIAELGERRLQSGLSPLFALK